MSMVPPAAAPPPGQPDMISPGVRQLVKFLQSRPEFAPLLAVFVQIAQADPETAEKIVRMAQANGGQGLQQVLQMLAEAAQAQQPPGAAPTGPAGPPPAPPGPPPGPPGVPPPGVPPGASLAGASPVPPGPPGRPQSDVPEPPGMGPQPPPPEPPAGGAANAPPGSMQELLADLPPNLSRLVRSLSPDKQDQVLMAYREKGIGVVENLLTQVEAAMQAAKGQNDPRTGALKRQQDGETPGRPKKRAKTTPNFALRELPANRWGKGPSYATCRRHLDQGKAFWKPRDLRIKEDTDLYNLSRARTETPTGPSVNRPASALLGDVVHVSAKPFQVIEGVTAYTTATGARKPSVDCPPWSDDDETIDASQAMEDYLAYSRELDERQWMRRGASGDPRMPLPRVEAGGMALLGGAGFKIGFDPEDKQHPIWSEYVPINRLYPVPGVAMVYSEQMTLAEARTQWPEINEYYPPEDEDDGDQNMAFQRSGPPPDMVVTVGAWTDTYDKGQGGLWHAIFWVTGDDGGWSDHTEEKRAKWIKKPTRIDFGFSPYQYVIWGGAPYYASQDVADYERFRGQGCLTSLRRTFKLLDLLWSATATGALKAVDPALVQYYLPGTRREDMHRFNTRPGATNYMIVGEKAEPLLWSVSGNPDGQTIIRALHEEIADAYNPALAGGGNAESGFQQALQQRAAGGVSVNPIMDALERYYELQNELKAELLIRKGDEQEIAKLPYPSRPADDRFDAVWPTMKALTPEVAKLNGTHNVVTYQRLSLMEQQVLWNMVGQAVQSKMLSARDGMKRMGIANPQRNLLRILQETAVMNPKALEAMTGAAIMGGGNKLFQVGWQQVLLANQQGGPPGQGGPGQGSPPAERGTPSPIGPRQMTGGPQGGPPAEMTGARPPMM